MLCYTAEDFTSIGEEFCMTNDNIPNPAGENAAEQDTAEKVNRRTLGQRAGRFLKYTAPAVIALMTAQQAHAS